MTLHLTPTAAQPRRPSRVCFPGTPVWLVMAIAACAVVHLAGSLPAQARWPDERKAGPFHCHANFSLDPYAELFAELDVLEDDLAKTLGIARPREVVHLYLFANRTIYQQYMRQYFPELPDRRALFVKRRSPGMVFAYLNREFDVDVRHESTHALLHASLPTVPLWLDEGLAEYFEVPREKRSHGSPHLSSVRWKLRFSATTEINALEAKRELAEMGRGDYRDSWAWVHFMLHGPPEAHDELVRYLADIHAEIPAGHLSVRLKRRIPDLEARFVEHFQKWE